MEGILEVIYRVRVDRENIGLINAIFEAYEEVAIVRVVDKKDSLMEIYTSSSFSHVVERIIEALKDEYGVKMDVVGREVFPCGVR
ncbi:MAG: DUF4911 domain-containing protein [Deferribacteres bacterium]|nr:DUF4911 domain-containing protein [Deferribacteres bacterium]